MTTAYDVPPDLLIKKVVEKFKDEPAIQQPDWALYAKTGVHTEKAPDQPDWWSTRAAAVLRKVYVMGPIGTERLRAEFGGYRDRGSKPNKAAKGSGSIARKCILQLEEAGLVVLHKKKTGRIVTPKGRRLLDNAAHEVKLELVKLTPALKKY